LIGHAVPILFSGGRGNTFGVILDGDDVFTVILVNKFQKRESNEYTAGGQREASIAVDVEDDRVWAQAAADREHHRRNHLVSGNTNIYEVCFAGFATTIASGQ
jgi:hypothetical protein